MKIAKIVKKYTTRVVVQLADGKIGHTAKMDVKIDEEQPADFAQVNEENKSIGSVMAAIKSGNSEWRAKAVRENPEAAKALREGAELAALLGF